MPAYEDDSPQEDTRDLLFKFLENKLHIENPRGRIEFQRVHRLGKPKANSDNKPRPILARFLRYSDKEMVMDQARKEPRGLTIFHAFVQDEVDREALRPHLKQFNFDLYEYIVITLNEISVPTNDDVRFIRAKQRRMELRSCLNNSWLFGKCSRIKKNSFKLALCSDFVAPT